MIIDILVLIFAIWAFVLGLKRGLIVQLCHFIGLYVAVLLAPKYALEVGSIIFDDPGNAYITGFALIIVATILLVWIVAPLLRYIIIWQPIRFLDVLLGGALNLATMVIITAVLFSVFDQINLGQEIRQDMLIELMDEYEGEEDQLKERIASLGEKQKDDYMRKYLNHRYISFETLNESRSFFPLADLGKSLVPTLRDVDTQIRGEVDGMVNDVLEDIDEKDIDLW
jgi:uncharacterized membrane protein required for colicin V production